MKRVVYLSMLAVFFIALTLPVIAQDDKVTLGATGTYIIDIVGSVAAAAVTALIGWVAAAFTKRTGIEIEAKHRDALHMAAMTGITIALSKLRGTAGTIGVEIQNQVVREGIQWMLDSVPEAIKFFGLDKAPEKIKALVESKLGSLQEQAVRVNVDVPITEMTASQMEPPRV